MPDDRLWPDQKLDIQDKQAWGDLQPSLATVETQPKSKAPIIADI